MKRKLFVVLMALCLSVPAAGCGGSEEKAAEENAEVKLQFGELLDVTENAADNSVVVKAKIQPSVTNDATIRQNYHNIVYLVTDYGFDKYDTIKYWAVADMTDGKEAKVIQFTVPKETIDGIANEQIFGTNMDSYIEDLFLHPSLR